MHDRLMKKILLISLIFHLVTPFFSEGFLHFDEHYQILEFLGLKLGVTPEASLPWEYQAKMRPWLWPFLYTGITKVLPLSPFALATLFRYISSLLGFFSLYLFTKHLQKDEANKTKILMLHFLFFVPFLHARISAEALGATLLSIGVAIYLLYPRQIFLSGVIIGLASITRYHVGISAIFIFFWLLFIKKEKWKELGLFVGGGLTALFLSILIDYWGYGTFVFAPYNYFYENIVNNRAAAWGVTPWWDYFRLIFKHGTPIIGPLLIAVTALFWWKNPKSLLTWITLPFFIVHLLVGHKELRFLFPILPFIPLMFDFKKGTKAILVLNLIFLIPLSFSKAHQSVSFFKNFSDYKIESISLIGDFDPFAVANQPMHFYYPNPPKRTPYKNGDQYVFASRLHEAPSNCKLMFANYSPTILEWANRFNLSKRMRLYALFDCPTFSR